VIGLLDKSEEDTASLRAPTYSEHARLVFDDGRYAEAVPLFQKAVLALDHLSAPEKFPADYAAFLDDYSAALEKTGREAEGESVSKRAEEIRQANPGASGKFVRRKYKRANQTPEPTAPSGRG
jgi:hypothetical protein